MPAQFENINDSMTRESVVGNGIHSIDNDIVITGISGRFPESSNIEEFKENLMKEIDMIVADERRFSTKMYGLPSRFGKIKDLNSFDASFFGVNPKQAHVMDPQIRILLELTYEAIIDAGINPSTTRGSRTGVFIGVTTTESNDYWLKDIDKITGYELLGCCRTMFANRISFAFDFTGPSYALDTACASSMYAMHQAVTAIRNGECDSAIIGGTNIILKPATSMQFNRLNMLSKDGKCMAFDASGNGYVRSEAIVTLYLQKAKDARRIYATVIHTKTNVDGNKSQGITYPNGEMQNQLMREVYNESGINPKDITYVEAHGTGTKVGDPEEINSIDKLFCKDRKTPLLIGSVKSNMGHAEASSGVCSIAKVLIVMESGMIPANLHFNTPNPNIPALKEERIRVITKATPWNGGLIAINSFGFGGSNAHVILRSNPKMKLSPILDTTKLLPRLVLVSGRTEEAVHTLLNKAKEYQKDNEFLSLLDAIHNNNIHGHNIRSYEIFSSDGMREMTETMNYNEKRPIWFVFSGMGTQWPGMGRELLSIEIFQRSLQRCADALMPYGIDLMNIIMNNTVETFENIIDFFVSIAAIQIALVDVLTAIGIYPDGIVGHSVGELGCAYADNTFTLEQTILAAYYRGKSIVNTKLEPGGMMVVGLSWKDAQEMCPPDVSPACNNSADSVTMSGPTESLLKFAEELKSKGIFTKMVSSAGIAFHSKYIASAGPKLRASLDKIIPNPKRRSAKWISSSIPESAWSSPLAQFSSSAYHVNNLLSPVFFQEAIAHIPKNAITIEIAPHCLLQAILRRSLSSTVTNISLQKCNHFNNLVFLLSNIGKLYIAGAQPDISKLYPPVNFPVGRGTPMISPLIKWNHSEKWKVASFEKDNQLNKFCNVIKFDLSKETDAYLMGHKINGRILFPGAGYLVLIWKTLANLRNVNFEQLPVIFENVHFKRATIMPKKKAIKFSIKISEETGDFEIYEANAIISSGNIRVSKSIENDQLPPLTLSSVDEKILPLNAKDIYKEFNLRGYEYNDIFQGINSCNNYGTVGKVRWSNEWMSYIDSMLQFYILSTNNKWVHLPTRIQYISINPVFHKQLVEKLSQNDGLPIYHYKNIKIIKSGGIKLKGLQCSTISKQEIRNEPKYKRHIFVPYENPQSLTKEPIREKMYALTLFTQIVQENIKDKKIKIVEVASDRAVEMLLIPFIYDIFFNQPHSLIKIDFQVITVSPNNYAETFDKRNMNIDIVLQNANKLPAQDVHLVMAANILSNRSYIILKNLSASLKPNCFILLEETAVELNLKTALKETDLTLVSRQTDSTGKNYLLLKKQNEARSEQPIMIQITEKNLSWLEDIKAALKEAYNKNQEILFISQGEELLGLAGLITCIRCEAPDINIRYVFIQDKNSPKFDLSVPYYAEQLNKELVANVLKGGQWGSYRYLPLDQQSNTSSVQVKHAYVDILTKGDLNTLKWIESPLNYQLDNFSNTQLCSVYYASLNFKDIMLASGKLSMDSLPEEQFQKAECLLGIEFSGRDANNRRVMGMVANKGLATTVLADPDFLWEVPDKWTLEEAATIPVAYATSYYALFIRGQLKAGESVLIHAGTGGVGQAAITIALHIGCMVFTTVGTLEKREYLKKRFPQLTDRHIGNSRSTSFEELILTETQGRGVDVILNSLAEEKLQAGIRCLARNGRFLEIGKYDMSHNHPIGMSIFLKNITFHGILLDMLFEESSSDKKELIKIISEGIKNGAIRPLPSTIFWEQQVEEGFRFMATGKHIGKVLLKIREEETKKHVSPMPKTIAAIPRTYMNPEKSYVVIGGLGGLGLEFVNWMINRQAKFIVLVSRFGIRTGYQALCMRRWRESGINIIISTIDVTTLSGAEHLIAQSNQLAPIGGIFNLAAILHDALIENLKEADFKAVILPKVDITRNLDVVSRKFCPSLDYFVVFSSISSGHGLPGQTNYGFANSAMERMIEQRKTNGLPGLAIQWGPVGDVGLFMDTIKNKDMPLYHNALPQCVSSCLTTIDFFLQQPHAVLFSVILAEEQSNEAYRSKSDLVESIANILGIKNIKSVNLNNNLADLGMDSLMGTEIKQILERNYNIILSPQEIRNLTFSKLQDLSATDITTRKEESVAVNADNILLMQWPSNEVLPKNVLIRMRTKNAKGSPLFIVHAIEGLVNALTTVASEFEGSIWGLQSIEEAPQNTIIDLAKFYVNTIKNIKERGPYNLAGYSFGCCVAIEMALQLESAGEKVNLTLIDGSPAYVRMQMKMIGKIDTNKDISSDSCVKALAYFSIQFNKQLNFTKAYHILKESKSEIEMFDEMLQIIGKTPFAQEDIKIAGYLLYKRAAASAIYNPNKKFKGPVTLIKATDNFLHLTKDYDLSEICTQRIRIEEVHGNHRTILLGESAKKIANLLQM